MPSENALERVARLLDLIPYLTKQDMKLAELAELVGTDSQDLERDLGLAFLCGLPGYTPDLLIDLYLDGDTVRVTEPQVLDQPRQVTAEEMSVIKLGIGILETSFSGAKELSATVESLKGKLSISQGSSASGDGEFAKNLEIVESALLNSKRIHFDYWDSMGSRIGLRTVTPWELVWRGGRTLIKGYDHERNGIRHFFLSQMHDVKEALGDPLYEGDVVTDIQDPGEVATLVFDYVPRWWLRRSAAFIERVLPEESRTVVELRFWSREWLIAALIPVLDCISDIQVKSWSSESIREALLSHFSGFHPSPDADS